MTPLTVPNPSNPDAPTRDVRPPAPAEKPPAPAHPAAILLRALRGRWIPVLFIGAILASIFAGGALLLVQPSYQANGIIRVAVLGSRILYTNEENQQLPLFDAFINAQVTYLKSRPVLERAVMDKDLIALGLSGDDTAVAELAAALTVARENKSEIITLSSKSGKPKLAAAMVNAVLDAYETLYGEKADRRVSIREATLSARVQELSQKLRTIAAQDLEIGQEYGADSMDKAHLLKLTQMQDLEKRVSDMKNEITQKQANGANVMDSGNGEIARLTVLDQAMSDMLFERAKRAAKLSSLAEHLSPQHPAFLAADAELKVIDQAIENRRQQITTLGKTGVISKTGGDPNAKATVDEMKITLTALEKQCEEVRTEARELNRRRALLVASAEEYKQYSTQLEEVRKGLEQVKLEGRTNLPARTEVAARAAVPMAPTADRGKVFAAVGGLLGFVLAIAGAVAIQLIHPRIRYSDELADLPRIRPSGRITDLAKHDSEAMDTVRRLRNQLQLAQGPRLEGPLVVATVSVGDQAVRADLAIAIADVFAETGLRTVLVDMDLVARHITLKKNLTGEVGITNLLQNANTPTFLPSGDRTYTLIPAGTNEMVEDHALSRRDIQTTIAQLRAKFDVLVLDVGPVDERLAAPLVLEIVDQAVLAVGVGQGTYQVKKGAVMINGLVHGRVASVLL
ncbi:MAG: hypothetical protein WCJ97_04430 [Phycisphaerae bacterium]